MPGAIGDDGLDGLGTRGAATMAANKTIRRDRKMSDSKVGACRLVVLSALQLIAVYAGATRAAHRAVDTTNPSARASG